MNNDKNSITFNNVRARIDTDKTLNIDCMTVSTKEWVPVLRIGVPVYHPYPEQYLLDTLGEKLSEIGVGFGRFSIYHLYPILTDIYEHELVTNLAMLALYESGKDMRNYFSTNKFALEKELVTYMIKHNGGGISAGEDKIAAFLCTLTTITQGESTFMKNRLGEKYDRLGAPFCGYIGEANDIFMGFLGDLHFVLHHQLIDENFGILTERLVMRDDGCFERWVD